MANHTRKAQAAASSAPGPQPKRDGTKAVGADAPRKGLVAALAIVLLLIILAAAVIAVIVVQPPFARGALEALGIASPAASTASAASAEAGTAADGEHGGHNGAFSVIDDPAPTAEERAAMDAEAKEKARTPLLAQCNGIDLHMPIAMADLTGILFHQASNDYALVATTQIPEADYDRVEAERTMRINRDQEGAPDAWADTEALHLWRETDDTDMDTSIDVGAMAGTTVIAPVDGTVVLIRDYRLYDEMDDIEIHIQPDGRPDLDVVLIHTYEPLVKAGDHVEAGITPLSHVRDIEAELTDVQLGFFTPEGVGGNHTHVQVNDANFEDYRQRRLSGAIEL